MKLKPNLALAIACFLSISNCLTASGGAHMHPPPQAGCPLGDPGPPSHVTVSERTMQALVDEAARATLEKFADKDLKEDQLSITLIDLRDLQRPVTASYRGNERIYPASVVKLFYLAAAHRWLEEKKIVDTPELRRSLKDMIVDSSNEATQYIVDIVTHTTGGYELPPKEMEKWQHQRNAVNRYFTSLGYTNINVNQKTFCEDAYGRESVSRGPKGENRNKLTTDATARLMMEIATGKSVTPQRSAQMMGLLKRDYSNKSKDADDQGRGFTGIALAGIEGAQLWSKAGWTSTTRHDVAYIELPDGNKFVLATFTTDHANEREIIPTVARVVISGLKDVRKLENAMCVEPDGMHDPEFTPKSTKEIYGNTNQPEGKSTRPKRPYA